MHNKKKVVVLDLDGTLADTTNLALSDPRGRRTPADILQFSPSFDIQNIFLFKPSLKRNISDLILCGIHVYVITRAPKAYASTLINLLGIDFCGLIASNSEFNGVPEKLQKIAELESVEKSQMLYIGDQLADEQAALEFGCDFQFPPWNKTFDNGVQILEDLIDTCESIACGQSDADENEIDFKNEFAKSLNLFVILRNFQTVNLTIDFENYDLKVMNQVLFKRFINKPVPSTNILRPIINPHFITRHKYEVDPELRSQLFEILQFCGFKAREIKSPGINEESLIKNVEIYTVFDYRNPVWGSELWRLIKDWKGSHSGPEVHLHFLEFIAVVLAGAVGIEESDSPSVIIPVPSSPSSVDQPGQVSNRLCARISELTGVPILHFLRKENKGTYRPEFASYPFAKKHIFLVDDQITKGDSVNGCLEVLKNSGIMPNQISTITWSASRPEDISLEFEDFIEG
jgi:predicted amidophosphoribosyltransferase